MTQYIDYSGGTIPGSTIRGAGYKGVIRYVEDPRQTLRTKHIRPPEYQELVSAGVDVLLYFELDTQDALGGFSAGHDNAIRARAGADWIGYPRDRPIIMACDRHVDIPQSRVAINYMQGAEAAIGHDRVGVYGFYDVIDPCIALGVGCFYVQAGIRPAASDPVHMWQRNDGFATVGGIECDVVEVLRPWCNAPTPTPIIPALTHLEDDNMYVRYVVDPTHTIIGILSGAVLIGLGNDEARAAEVNIANGALCQPVGKATWDALDQRSHREGDNPRPVVVVPGIKA